MKGFERKLENEIKTYMNSFMSGVLSNTKKYEINEEKQLGISKESKIA